jgi:hypothetical protein
MTDKPNQDLPDTPHPDHGLPGKPGHRPVRPDHGLPGTPGNRPDQELPEGPHPDQELPETPDTTA